jgi:predicted AlkP superfamily pyrophosphatase or phosphodiesterase
LLTAAPAALLLEIRMLLKHLVWFSLLIASPAFATAAAPRAQHVVIISVDGFPAYLLEDPKAPIPNVRRLAREGVSAAGMRVINPSVTWPNHTSLVTGVRADKHGVLANGILTRHGSNQPITIEPHHDQAEMVRMPTLFDLAHQAGMSTAAINWPCTRNSTSLDDNFPDVPDAVEYTTPRLREELQAAGLLTGEAKDFIKNTSAPQRDLTWTEATRLVLNQRKPRLTLLHLLNVDATHHALGPQTPGGYTAIGLADACIGRVLEGIAAAGIADQTAVFIVADHGFTQTPRALKPNVLLRREGFLKEGRGGKIEDVRAVVVPEGGMGLLYFCDPNLSEEERQKIEKLLAEQEGIAQVIRPQQFGEYGLPNPRADSQMSDLVLLAQEGFGFSGRADGDEFVVPGEAAGVPKGSHGFTADLEKMNAVFVAAGAGVQQGVRLGLIKNLDVAPTAAALLGFSMPTADGRVLSEALSGAAKP